MTPPRRLTAEEIEHRVSALLLMTRKLLETFRGGYNPTEGLLGGVENACLALDMPKMCGHAIREECDCE